MIQNTTIKKFFRDHFKGENPIRGTINDLKQLANPIKERIKGIQNVKIDDTLRYYHSEEKQKRLICCFSIYDESEGYYYRSSNDFRILASETGELMIEEYGNTAVISDIEEIVSFISACLERLERQRAQRIKRQKLRDFKSQAIIAQVKKVAKEEKFDFYTSPDMFKLNLYVRLFDKKNDCIEIHIPFNKFQEVLPELRSSIVLLRELCAKGIKFKFKTVQFYRDEGWIRHETL